MLNPDELYDNAFQPDNVYGHTIALLERYRDAGSPRAGEGDIHLDLGCGFGRMAEVVRDRLGLTYVGVDGAHDGPASLNARGFEAHQLLFETFEQTLSDLQRIVGDRRVVSLTMLDTLEHLTNGDEVLRAIRELIGPSNAPAVISVPNVGHRDVGFKLAFGRWDYTREGLLDHTHVRLFSRISLIRTFQAAGLQLVDSNDVQIVNSDQHFPDTHPALTPGTTLGSLLSGLRDQVDRSATVNQFVALIIAGPKSQLSRYLQDEEQHPKRPFLSVVMRTQGKRPHTMVEALTALAGQKDRDFELLVIGHKLSSEQQKSVERLLEDSPAWLRDQTRLIRVDDGNRTRPLNRGFEEAAGEYIAILDDDDVPMAHWVSTFRALAEQQPGAVLRTIAARQDVDIVDVDGQSGVRAIGGLEPYPARFDLLQHLIVNETPPVALAFPRGAFHDLNIRFDETLTTTEDWDFLLRCAVVVGVCASEEITAVYHWWKLSVESSRTVHDQAEWDANYQAIHRKLDAHPILLPAGSARQLRLLRTLHNVRDTGVSVSTEGSSYLKEVVKILSSRSWRWSALLRWPAMLRGRKDPQITDCLDMSESQLAALLARLRKSSSWRITAIFHRSLDK
jgi:hypothetical protein